MKKDLNTSGGSLGKICPVTTRKYQTFLLTNPKYRLSTEESQSSKVHHISRQSRSTIWSIVSLPPV